MRKIYCYHVIRTEEGSRQEYPFKTLKEALFFIAKSEKRKYYEGEYEIYRVELKESWAFKKQHD